MVFITNRSFPGKKKCFVLNICACSPWPPGRPENALQKEPAANPLPGFQLANDRPQVIQTIATVMNLQLSKVVLKHPNFRFARIVQQLLAPLSTEKPRSGIAQAFTCSHNQSLMKQISHTMHQDNTVGAERFPYEQTVLTLEDALTDPAQPGFCRTYVPILLPRWLA